MGIFAFLVFMPIIQWTEWRSPESEKLCPLLSQNLHRFPYMEKDVIKLRVLRGGVYPGLFGWALKAVTRILV